MSVTERAQSAFGPIALSLSGGGYRAAAFHLGTLSYLNRLGLLEDVQILSTVSGGTLVGMKFALSQKQGIRFEAFFDEFYAFLRDVNLNSRSLEKIGRLSQSTASGYYDLITAFAESYNEVLLKDAKFGIFWEPGEIPLKEIVFNATEFKTGIAFRFQKSENPDAKIGNGNISILEDVAKQIRLADIAAASACFPGGFEPLAFPKDFSWPEGKVPAELGAQFENQLALMDGGVYDNQGIDGVMNAVERTKAELGIFIISDTDKRADSLYQYPDKVTGAKLTVAMVNYFAIGLILLSVFSFAALAVQWISVPPDSWLTGILLFGFPALLCVLTAGSIYILRRKIKSTVLSKVPKVATENVWNDLRRLSIEQVVSLIQLRITSLFALASRVFMRRIRSLVYAQLYEDDRYKDKRISNLIDDLIRPEKKQVADFLNPSESMRDVANQASNMPTTLWFENESEQRNLVACGQFTMCYNLIEFLIRNFGVEVTKYPSHVAVLYQKAMGDWNSTKSNPLALLER